jgi:DMSO reductase anchor subunit
MEEFTIKFDDLRCCLYFSMLVLLTGSSFSSFLLALNYYNVLNINIFTNLIYYNLFFNKLIRNILKEVFICMKELSLGMLDHSTPLASSLGERRCARLHPVTVLRLLVAAPRSAARTRNECGQEWSSR